jgi:hypothetical protein
LWEPTQGEKEMTLEEAVKSGAPMFRRKNFVQWLRLDSAGAIWWQNWNVRFHPQKDDHNADDWETWDGVVKTERSFGPTETKSI